MIALVIFGLFIYDYYRWIKLCKKEFRITEADFGDYFKYGFILKKECPPPGPEGPTGPEPEPGEIVTVDILKKKYEADPDPIIVPNQAFAYPGIPIVVPGLDKLTFEQAKERYAMQRTILTSTVRKFDSMIERVEVDDTAKKVKVTIKPVVYGGNISKYTDWDPASYLPNAFYKASNFPDVIFEATESIPDFLRII